jgi:hypothetical protein
MLWWEARRLFLRCCVWQQRQTRQSSPRAEDHGVGVVEARTRLRMSDDRARSDKHQW